MEKKTCLAREKRAFLFVQGEKLNMQGENPALGIFPKATIYAKTALKKNRMIHSNQSFGREL
jgi:hypothetical protein